MRSMLCRVHARPYDDVGEWQGQSPERAFLAREWQGRSPERARFARESNGFTLIEVMIVMLLIIILASISLAVYGTSTQRAREAALKQNLFQMRDAIDQYYADKGQYPPTLDTLVSERYLRNIPEDPFTNSTGTWLTTLADYDATNPGGQPGIYDVKSGSDRLAMDGSRVAEW